MVVQYANAYTEVYKILECLNEEDYDKIPKEFIHVIEENRNLDYEYEVNEEQDLSKQPMLIETRAILYKIFRDFLATSEQKEKIKRWEDEEARKLEQVKREKYGVDVFEKKSRKENTAIMVVENKDKGIFNRIIDKIKKVLKGKI